MFKNRQTKEEVKILTARLSEFPFLSRKYSFVDHPTYNDTFHNRKKQVSLAKVSNDYRLFGFLKRNRIYVVTGQ